MKRVKLKLCSFTFFMLNHLGLFLGDFYLSGSFMGFQWRRRRSRREREKKRLLYKVSLIRQKVLSFLSIFSFSFNLLTFFLLFLWLFPYLLFFTLCCICFDAKWTVQICLCPKIQLSSSLVERFRFPIPRFRPNHLPR